MTEGEQFLRSIFPDPYPEGLYQVIWTLSERKSYWCPTMEGTVKVAERAVTAGHEVFFHVGLSDKPDVKNLPATRPHKANIQYLPAVWADMDLSPSQMEAAGVSGEVERPDIIVNSGHGQHWYWLLDQPAVGNEECQRLVWGWFTFLRGHGIAFDEAAKDVCRILRYPGSTNAKDIHNPVPVEVTYPEMGARLS